MIQQYKTLGIIGGMGPLATLFFYEKMIALTQAATDQDHLPVLVCANTKTPNRVHHIIHDDPQPVIDCLVDSAQRLIAAGADFLALPCNTAHHFINLLPKPFSVPFLHMIDRCIDRLSQQHVQSATLLSTTGTIQSKIYHNAADQAGITIRTPEASIQLSITSIIDSIKAGTPPGNLYSELKAIVLGELSKTDVVILGCTELPLPLKHDPIKHVIDPMDILAADCIEHAGYSLRARIRV